MTTRGVVVMGKLPYPGRVKTRMCPPLRPEQSASLYRAFLLDVFHLVERSAPDAEHVFSCALFEGQELAEARAFASDSWKIVEQSGEGLGERIEDARSAAATDHVIVMGSDAPTMAEGRIAEAFAKLADHDAVFGPTEDGGYDLVGFAARQVALLEGIPWSTPDVMAATERAAARAGLAIAKLDPGYDVDHADELPRAYADAVRLERFCTASAIAALARTLAPD